MTISQKVMLFVAVALLLSVPFAHAQTVENMEARWFNPGASAPISTYSFAAADFACGQVAPPVDPDPVINVNTGATLIWDDPDSPGDVCMHVVGAGSSLFALPIPGSYEVAAVASNAVGTSGESNRAPFRTLDPPVAQTGLRVVR